jgi:NADH-quinone oxidoreductase subunit J
MTEFWLFMIVGLIAIVSAMLMLIQENAVYSALLLIVTMACIAFLFLLLNAPFLAMIQITVYAGAIMVLFIFVIMLLGAERVGAAPAKFRWMTPLAVGLSILFLLGAGIALSRGDIDTQAPPAAAPQVRVINAAADTGPVDVWANDTLVASGLEARGESPFVSLEPGQYDVRFVPTNGEEVTSTIQFDPGTVQTIVALGENERLALTTVPNDLSTPANGQGRITLMHAFPEAETVDVYDMGANREIDHNRTTGAITDRPVLTGLGQGQASDLLNVDRGTINWAFVNPADGSALYRLRDYEVGEETSQLVVLGAQRLADGSIRAVAEPGYVDEARASFGGPKAIGQQLLTTFLLPFELVSLLLLAAMVGAILLTHKEDARVRDRSTARRRVSRPLTSVIASQVGHDVMTKENDTPALPAEGKAPAGD